MKKLLIFLLVATSGWGCVKESRDTTTPAGCPDETDSVEAAAAEAAAETSLFVLDDDEIERIIGDVVAMLDGMPTTRVENPDATNGAGSRVVESIRTLYVTRETDISSELTSEGRSLLSRADANEAPDETATTGKEALFHVVDFADERGYCVIAADRRLDDEIICFVGHGSFPDTLENPGIAIMMTLAAQNALHETGTHTPSVTRAGVEVRKAPWRTNKTVGPMLPVEWGQGKPFNATVLANTQWPSTPVGCVALAAVGLMAYWQHPRQFKDLALDWSELTRRSGAYWNREGRYRDWDGPMTEAPAEMQKTVADLLWYIGNEVGMRYGPTVSTAYSFRATELLASLGMSQTESQAYSEQAVRNSLELRRPVWIDGASHTTVDGNGYANAHAWLIDGYLEQRQWDGFEIDGHLYEVERFRGFFHNNFGWNGTDNGWYACGVFDANNDPDMPSNTTRVEWIGQSYNYQYMLTIYPDIYK